MIFTHLVQRIVSAQEEEKIKDLALSTFEQVWFSASTIDTRTDQGSASAKAACAPSAPKVAAAAGPLESHVLQIVDVVAEISNDG